MAALLVVAVLVGCGSTGGGPTFTRVVPPATHQLALGRERVAGGAVVVVAVRYSIGGARFLGVRSRIEEGTPAEARRSGGFSTGLARHYELLSTVVGEVCVANRRYRLAYGLLGRQTATVFAEGGGPAVPLFKVAIPQKEGGRASLVYRVLRPGQTTLVARAPSGRVLKREVYGNGYAAGKCD
jgi:hypothetical protein